MPALKDFTFYTRGLHKRLATAGLMAAEQLVLLELLTYWSPDTVGAVMFPAVDTLVALGHAERTVRRTRARCEELGLLSVEIGGGRKSNRYFATDLLRSILFPPEVQQEDQQKPTDRPKTVTAPVSKTTTTKRDWSWHDGVLDCLLEPPESRSWARSELDKVLPEHRGQVAAHLHGKGGKLIALLSKINYGTKIPAKPQTISSGEKLEDYSYLLDGLVEQQP